MFWCTVYYFPVLSKNKEGIISSQVSISNQILKTMLIVHFISSHLFNGRFKLYEHFWWIQLAYVNNVGKDLCSTYTLVGTLSVLFRVNVFNLKLNFLFNCLKRILVCFKMSVKKYVCIVCVYIWSLCLIDTQTWS